MKRLEPKTDKVTRRAFIGGTLLAGASLLLNLDALARDADANHSAFANGTLVKVVPFIGEVQIPPGKLFESGLDGRLYADLSKLQPNKLIVPADEFYVRTACSDLIDFSKPWQIKVASLDAAPHMIPLETIEKLSRDMGVHLMECSGNERAGQFGLMSACQWSGVPLLAFLHHIRMVPHKGQRICVSGFDKYAKPSGVPGLRSSIPGASWIFTAEELKSTDAFLATQMNGNPLPHDHGFPVRLVVPGWYGCTCIKWVDEITFVPDDARATSQMQEFAGRTHQDGIPELARDFKAPSIDQAAMPIRVEQWSVAGKIKYNVVGIMWGGQKLTRDLQIRFLPDEKYYPVENYDQTTNSTWTLWYYEWSPEVTGDYRVQLRIADANIRTKRLDKGYYDRAVRIAEV